MKTFVMSVVVVCMMVCGANSLGWAAPAKSGMKVGMTVQDLSNQIWAGACQKLKKTVEADGGSMIYVDCASNSAQQIQQLENFIASGVTILVIQPVQVAAVESTLLKARSKGIKVFCWDEDVQNADISWLVDNYELGKMIGTEAAQWINDKHNGACEVAVLGYSKLPILLQRSKGIVDAINSKAPRATIVAQSDAINPTEGMAKTETILQAHPKVKVIACIGGGGAVGANEAVKSSHKLTPDFGVFAADATRQELVAIKAQEANRMSVLITGGAESIALEIYSWLKKLIKNESVPAKVYRVLIPVTAKNVDQYLNQ